MLMRYRGGGVGHKSTRAATNIFLKDRDRLDMQNNDVDISNSEDVQESAGDAKVNDGNERDSSTEEARDNASETWVDVRTEEDEEEPELDGNELGELDGNDVVFEEEFDYGYRLDSESDTSEDEELQEVDDDALGPEDGDDNEEDPEYYADL